MMTYESSPWQTAQEFADEKDSERLSEERHEHRGYECQSIPPHRAIAVTTTLTDHGCLGHQTSLAIT